MYLREDVFFLVSFFIYDFNLEPETVKQLLS